MSDFIDLGWGETLVQYFHVPYISAWDDEFANFCGVVPVWWPIDFQVTILVGDLGFNPNIDLRSIYYMPNCIFE